MDLRTEGGIEMLKYFRNAIYSGSEVGDMLLMNVQTSQLESGQPIPLLADPTIYIPYLTATWVMSLRQFMSNHNIKIDLTQTLTLSLKSTTDEFIMSQARLQGYSIQQQKDLNLVRIFLQVTSLADLMDDQDGRLISTWGQAGERPPLFVVSKSWPRQESISKSQQRLWRRYIESQFLRYNRYWRQSPHERARCEQVGIEVQSPKPTMLSSMIKTLPKHQRRLLSHVKQRVNDDELWSICRKKKSVTIASDGGLKGRQGTFGWHLSTGTNQPLFEGAGPVDGPFDSANSTRCELGGDAASLLLLSLLSTMWGTKVKCKLRWVSDSKSAITRVKEITAVGHRPTKQPNNADLLEQIKAYSSTIRQTIRPTWVKGHQTASQNPTSETDFDTIRNNHADELATWYRNQSSRPQSKESTDHT